MESRTWNLRRGLEHAFVVAAASIGGLASGCGGGAAAGGSAADALNVGLGPDGGAATALGCASPPPGNLTLIDDMENGDNQILVASGRSGYWYTYDDGSAGLLNPAAMSRSFSMEPIPGGRCGVSQKAMRMTGSGFMTWGCGMGFFFALGPSGTDIGLYDASGTKGITFWAKVGELSVKDAVLLVGDQWTDPAGGHCDATVQTGPTACYDSFSAPLTLTTSWQRYSFTWAELVQRMFGLQRAAPDVANLATVNFQLGASSSVFDVWIDDVAFFQ
jgi:hypothetical protein